MALRSRHNPSKLRAMPTGIWPYAWSLALMFLSSAFLWFGDQMLMRYAMPWALISLIVVATSSVLWGVRPAIFVLLITGMFGDIVAPDLHISYFYGQPGPWQVHLTRMLLYLICGATMVWLAHQARTMRETTERKRLALQAMQALAAPEHLATAAGWRVASRYLPARADEEVGGDFFDFFALDASSTTFGVLVGDVMGKGKEAAAHTAMLRYTVRAFASEGREPADILHRLNAQVDADPHAPTASLFFGVLDRAAGTLVYASGGHEPPALLRVDGSHWELASTGPLIGVGCDVCYEQRRVQVEMGEKLLLVTDGVTEARSKTGEFLDMEGAVRLFRRCSCLDPERALDDFTDGVMRFAGGNNRDDIAIMLVCRDAAVTAREPIASSASATPSLHAGAFR